MPYHVIVLLWNILGLREMVGEIDQRMETGHYTPEIGGKPNTLGEMGKERGTNAKNRRGSDDNG